MVKVILMTRGVINMHSRYTKTINHIRNFCRLLGIQKASNGGGGAGGGSWANTYLQLTETYSSRQASVSKTIKAHDIGVLARKVPRPLQVATQVATRQLNCSSDSLDMYLPSHHGGELAPHVAEHLERLEAQKGAPGVVPGRGRPSRGIGLGPAVVSRHHHQVV
eukprot:scaffold178124_cov28-Prasinocladus_malaysianus.AAC.1